MRDEDKTEKQMIDKLEKLRPRIAELEISEAECKQMEKALQESELKFRSVAQSANDAIISSDRNGHIVFWNAAAQKMFGYTEEQAMGKPLTILMPERYRDTHQQGMERHSSMGESNVIGNTIEPYIRDRSEAHFTHGLCPDCTEKITSAALPLFQHLQSVN